MSNIEWTEVTWNPVIGCTPVSPGCLNCYAATMARRLEAMGKAEYQPVRRDGDGRDVTALPGLQDGSDRIVRVAEVKAGRAVFTGDVRTVADRLTLPLHWKKPRRVFVNSMSDLFHKDVPFEYIDKVFAVMALCQQHTFQVLTKRPERMAEYLATEHCLDNLAVAYEEMAQDRAESDVAIDYFNDLPWPLSNIWLGTSVENQATADERIPHLLKCPAAVRFLSCEPLLGAVDLCRVNFGEPGIQNVLDCRVSELAKRAGIDKLNGIDWVIVGGESGPHARPCDVAWIRSVVKQCRGAGVPVFVKQLGADCADTTKHGEWFRGRANKSAEEAGYFGVRRLNDRKGGDPAEWPEELRVREFPAAEVKRIGGAA